MGPFDIATHFVGHLGALLCLVCLALRPSLVAGVAEGHLAIAMQKSL